MDILLLLLISIALIALLGIYFVLKRLSQKIEIIGNLDTIMRRFEDVNLLIQNLDRTFKDDLERNRSSQSDEFQRNRVELTETLNKLIAQFNVDSKANREELANALLNLSQSLTNSFKELNTEQRTQLENLRKSNEQQLNKIQEDNSSQLEKMRVTVDEKLHETLEKRLGDSFKLVSDRLEQVHQGLGEMKTLATGVGDLKKVLSNVKTRGVLGEYQLENILVQLLTPEQYVKNFKPRDRRDDNVEFAVKLPAKDEENSSVYLPIDAKFPVEDYHRLIEAYDVADVNGIETARKQLVYRIKSCAKDISTKYIYPPKTTDFAIMFLPFEGLYAEVLRYPDLFDTIQRENHVILTGPSTISALLNSLQMGFRTLAIEKRSSEVWKLLSAIKTEFGKFGEVLSKTQNKLREASDVIDKATHRSNQIVKKLRSVQDLNPDESQQILELAQPEMIEATHEEET